MKKNIKLTKEERDILKSAESGGFIPAVSKKRDIAQYSKIAKATLAKNKTISIRISKIDLMKLKAKAAQEGMPYQTLISSSLHRLTVNG
jgi:predicted DNA binding CopG/RHH family protein